MLDVEDTRNLQVIVWMPEDKAKDLHIKLETKLINEGYRIVGSAFVNHAKDIWEILVAGKRTTQFDPLA